MDVEHEIVVKRQVIVMECKLLNKGGSLSTWTPCASSTPIRRPLVTLSNLSYVNSAKQRVNNDCQTATEDKVQEESLKPAKKIGKTNRSRAASAFYSSSEDEDDDKLSNENASQSKTLRIQVGSSQNMVGRKKKIQPVNDNSCTHVKSEIDKKPEILTKEDERVSSSKEKEVIKAENDKGNIGKTAVSKSDHSKRKKNAVKLTAAKSEILYVDDSHMQKHGGKFPAASTKVLKTCKSQIQFKKEINEVEYKCDDNVDLEEVKVTDVKDAGKLSVSHEIFSDHKEIEHRDSLDLTAVDYDEPNSQVLGAGKCGNKHQKRKRDLLEVNKVNQKHKGDIKENENESDDKTKTVVRSKRTRRSPKEYWLPKSMTNESIEHPAVVNCLEVEEAQSVSSSCEEVQNINERISSSKTLDDNREYVKDLNDINFIENNIDNNKEVFSVGLGWQLPKFKCCVLKIQKKCEASGSTTHETSHFGGIVLKGKLTMTIDGSEFKLNRGKMFHVPPLKNWKAVNTGTTECELYYWCGRM